MLKRLGSAGARGTHRKLGVEKWFVTSFSACVVFKFVDSNPRIWVDLAGLDYRGQTLGHNFNTSHLGPYHRGTLLDLKQTRPEMLPKERLPLCVRRIFVNFFDKLFGFFGVSCKYLSSAETQRKIKRDAVALKNLFTRQRFAF